MSFYDNSIEYMLLDLNFKTDWNNILKKSMLQNISEQISENYYPPKEKIFNAFNHFNFLINKSINSLSISGLILFHK